MDSHAFPPNILVTSAGRRTGLVRALCDAVHPLGGLVVAADMDALAPALYLADKAVRVPAIRSGQYMPELLRVTAEERIRLLVPTIDTDLATLAQNADRFSALGCRVAVSSADFVRIAGDKWLTMSSFGAAGVDVPASWLPDEALVAARLPRRLFLKPRDGSASMHTYACDRADLASVLSRVPNAIVQEEVDGPEITIDAFVSQDGRPIHFVPRRRMRTLGGESIQGVTLPASGGLGEWIGNVLRVAARLGARGPITLQAFDSPRGFLLSEVNPRFGGGFPLGLAAGATYPQFLVEELAGERIDERLGAYEVGLYMTRANAETFTRKPKW